MRRQTDDRDGGGVVTRRLIGWRVHWETLAYLNEVWLPDWTGVLSRTATESRARLIRGDGRARNVRIVRVYRRKVK